MQRLTQQLPAFLELVGGHEMQAGVAGVVLVVLSELGVELAIQRMGFPGVARRTRLREFGQPHVQTLRGRVGAEQPMQRRGAGAHQPGDEDGPLDGDLSMLRVLLPRGFRQQPGHQGAAQEEPIHLAAQHRKTGFLPVGVQQHTQRFAVVVVVDAEVVEPGQLGGRGMQLVDGRNVGAFGHQVWYSPQLTSSVCPLMPLDKSLAMNMIADATSSSVGSRLRSEFAAVA